MPFFSRHSDKKNSEYFFQNYWGDVSSEIILKVMMLILGLYQNKVIPITI